VNDNRIFEIKLLKILKRAEGFCDIVIVMPNTQSKPIANKVAERIQSHVKSFPPPIALFK
jgi:hypothetical protein